MRKVGAKLRAEREGLVETAARALTATATG
jgi:hypothetical protein